MEGIDHIVDQAALHHAAQVYLLSNQLSINFEQRWILKKLVSLAASPKSVKVSTNLAPNFDLEDLF